VLNIRNIGRVGALAAAVGLGASSAAAAGWELRVCADRDNLPYSNEAGEGFENRVAAVLAEALGSELTYVWLPDTRGATRQRYLQAGACDAVMGVLDKQKGYATSHAYYRTGYVFLFPEDAGFEVASLDDAILGELRIGVPGGARKLVPPSIALANRGVLENQVHFDDRRAGGERHPPVIRALEDGTVDVAVVWGPVAGHYAREHGNVVVAPVRPEIDIPFLPMVASLAIGMRPDDVALRDLIDVALARTWDETRAVLEEAGVPLLALPRPAPPEERGG
jgi:mxaJ protein